MGDPAGGTPARSPTVAVWDGELLWPQPLDDGDIIDLARVTALGTWTYAWFRARPGRAVVRATPAVRRQLLRSGVQVMWGDPTSAMPSGVGPGEKAMLFGGP